MISICFREAKFQGRKLFRESIVLETKINERGNFKSKLSKNLSKYWQQNLSLNVMIKIEKYVLTLKPQVYSCFWTCYPVVFLVRSAFDWYYFSFFLQISKQFAEEIQKFQLNFPKMMAKIVSHVGLFPILSTVFPAISSRQFGHNNLFHAQGSNSELIWQLHGFPVFLSLSNHTVLKLIKKQPPVEKK